MAQFCEGCPIQGTCTNNIIDVKTCTIADTTSPEAEERTRTTVSQFYDVAGGASEVIGGVVVNDLLQDIPYCDGPIEVVEKQFLRKPTIIRVRGATAVTGENYVSPPFLGVFFNDFLSKKIFPDNKPSDI